ncbi:S8 family peptidase [Duganella callida]|uniref:S8 family peptidase n=2 Tax=Duganella callida TaxID=2561932 RepID=A0A4Y9SZT7_9BURK|nr:S8 family peptidase [Duganella callida]
MIHPSHADEVRRSYIVELADQPVAAYSGNIGGLRATKVAPGQRLDLNANAARQYRTYLSTQQAQAKALLPASAVTREYQVVFNGFAANLTDAEVRALKASGKAVRITPDVAQHVVTNYTPTFLGLDQPGGLWEQLGGKAHAGEDIIVGVIDTGIWPENLSYADRVDSKGQPTFDASGTLAYGPPPARWKGVCQTGEGYTAADCNNKLIGARYFDSGFRASGNAIHWSEFRSPRDSLSAPAGDGGHGTHTSSTAAGNANVPAVAENGDLLAARSGMAPHARVAMYKICWSYQDKARGPQAVGNTCYNSDSLAAIEAAVADGVDVLNYSISGGETPLDPVEQAFRHAVEAGVFVAAAAGNAGPDNAVAHIAPWLTTVAASTVDKAPTAIVTLGNGQQYSGISAGVKPLPAAPVIRAEDAASAGADSIAASNCTRVEDVGGRRPIAPLDPAKVAGKIVACQRSSFYNPESAGQAVKAAGGVGMILLDSGDGTFVDIYSVPTVHVSYDDGQAIAAYAANPGATAAFSANSLSAVKGPVLARFSSRGPNMFDSGVLKPDMAAPGVDILAGIAPSLSTAQRDAVIAGGGPAYSTSAYMSGTSMATPHVAGLAALLKQRHPGWSPAAVKSALMTTTRTVLPTDLGGDQDGTLPWGQGAGLVVPNGAADPGLVYDIGAPDYQKYLCGMTGESSDCTLGALKSHALNLASISLPNVVGTQTVSRSVTNVSDKLAIYNASAAIDGFDVTVTPSTLTLEPGQTRSYSVTLARTDAADGVWKFGQLVWNDGEHNVRSPLQARFNGGVDAPARVSASTVSGSRQIELATGYNGKLAVMRGGLREYTRAAQTVQQAKAGSLDSMGAVRAACAARSPGVKAIAIGIPDKTAIARFELSNRDTAGGADDDLDLMVMDENNIVLGYSGHSDANESVTLIAPRTMVVKICVIGFKLKSGTSTDYTLSYATAIPNDTKGAVKVSLPDAVKVAGLANVGVSWSGLEQGKRYLGGLQWRDQDGRVLSTTELNIDTRDVTPAAAAMTKSIASE